MYFDDTYVEAVFATGSISDNISNLLLAIQIRIFIISDLTLEV